MQLREWLRASGFTVKSFAERVDVERAMIYRYFTGAIPRTDTIRRIEQLTNGAVRAQDFYDNAVSGTGAYEAETIPDRPPANDHVSTAGD